MIYFKIRIENLEPLCISNDSSSQKGQTDCLRYIPGTTLRGHFINSISSDATLFETTKCDLFSDKVSFMNAYPLDGDDVLIPSLKGFYEDKNSNGEIDNVLISGSFKEGMKRAYLGSFCKMDGSTITYYSIATKSSMKINISGEKQEVFRTKNIEPGYIFESYVVIKNEELTEEVSHYLVNKLENIYNNKTIWLGNGKSQGLGKCRAKIESCDNVAFSKYLPDSDVSGEIYMILLSDSTMRDTRGEYCGINCRALENFLGVNNLKINYCSTSVINIHGYNQKLGIMTPTVPMYEKGSAFKLSYDGVLSLQKMYEALLNGVGERKNEGFGRLIFIDGKYECLDKKNKEEIKKRCFYDDNIKCSDEDKKVIKIVAKNYARNVINTAIQHKLLNDKELDDLNNSQVGKIVSLLEMNRNNPQIKKIANDYFAHALDKENKQNIQKERKSIYSLKKLIEGCLNEDISTLFDIKTHYFDLDINDLFDDQELIDIRLSYIRALAKYSRKGN